MSGGRGSFQLGGAFGWSATTGSSGAPSLRQILLLVLRRGMSSLPFGDFLSPNFVKYILILSALFFVLTLLFPSSISQNFSSGPVAPDHACSFTTDPSFCQSLLPSESLSNFYGYGQYLIKKSLQQSYAFSSLINETIRDKATLTPQAAAALNDCLPSTIVCFSLNSQPTS
ncbi:hypothetical protein EJ110_NYTH22852 [Nymphaea thermarum]|nr:hypothetical protein EJ110_NYTH22852 [Nymphaea thermarum]